MFSHEFWDQFGRNWGVLPALFAFGLLYDLAVAWMERHGHDEGFTAIQVVVGVLVTVILAGPLIGWQAVILMLGCFACSGMPMIAGALWRFWQKQRLLAETKRSVRDGNTTTPAR